MTKRAASYDIDPVTFEEKERNEEKDNPIDPEGPHMKNRKYSTFYQGSLNSKEMKQLRELIKHQSQL